MPIASIRKSIIIFTGNGGERISSNEGWSHLGLQDIPPIDLFHFGINVLVLVMFMLLMIHVIYNSKQVKERRCKSQYPPGHGRKQSCCSRTLRPIFPLILFFVIKHHFVRKTWYFNLIKNLHSLSNYSDVISDKIMVYYKEEYERENGAKSARATQPLATVSKWTLALASPLFHRCFIEISIFLGIYI